jgi:hypothetical protein
MMHLSYLYNPRVQEFEVVKIWLLSFLERRLTIEGIIMIEVQSNNNFEVANAYQELRSGIWDFVKL